MNGERTRRTKRIFGATLQWTKEQIRQLDKMDEKLKEMKKLAEYVAGNNLSLREREGLSIKLEKLKDEYELLEKQRHIELH